MRILKWFVMLALFALVLTAGILFTIQNEAAVPLDLLVVQLPAKSVALWVLSAFAVGALAGMGISSVAIVRLKGQSMLLRRRLNRGQKEQGRSSKRDPHLPVAKS